MMRDNLIRLVVAVLVLATAALLVMATEWTDVDVATPVRGEAAKNPLYAAQALARGLGASVVLRKGLTDVPSPQATLVLISRHWDLFPEREKRLHKWVRNGGQLVIPKWAMDLPSLENLVFIDDDEVKRKPSPPQCQKLTEPSKVAPAYPELPAETGVLSRPAYRICAALVGPALKASATTTLWAVQSNDGVEVLRVAVGRGSVTVVGPWDLMDNTHLLREDNALLAAAALQMRPGADIWFVAEEARMPLLAWLWQNAWPVALAGLLAIALALWRSTVRFGPLLAPASTQRRSMTEQVLGTAQFLHKHGGVALHTAALRALRETAQARLRNFSVQSVVEQARLLAAVTGLNEHALAQALTPPRSRGKQALSLQLELLETARRRLLDQGLQPRASDNDQSNPS